jgi:hypothetical protein
LQCRLGEGEVRQVVFTTLCSSSNGLAIPDQEGFTADFRIEVIEEVTMISRSSRKGSDQTPPELSQSHQRRQKKAGHEKRIETGKAKHTVHSVKDINVVRGDDRPQSVRHSV